MANLVSYEYELDVRDEFRECYAPPSMGPRGSQRHWMLDHSGGRDLLKMAARKYYQSFPLVGEPEGVDAILNEIIDKLGMRELAKPENALQDAILNAKFLGKMAKVIFFKSCI